MQYKVELVKPNGVKHMSSDSAVIDVTLSNDITNVYIEDNIITWENLPNGYTVEPVDDIVKVTVNAKGVTSVVNDITKEDISVYFDVNEIDLNSANNIYEVTLHVQGNDSRVEFQSSVLKIKVKIYKK